MDNGTKAITVRQLEIIYEDDEPTVIPANTEGFCHGLAEDEQGLYEFWFYFDDREVCALLDQDDIKSYLFILYETGALQEYLCSFYEA